MHVGPVSSCQRKRNGTAQLMVRRTREKIRTRGVAQRQATSWGILISRDGIQLRLALFRRRRAPLVWLTCSAMVGNGLRLCSRPSKASSHSPYRGYSADFFDDKHYVMKGGSPRTAA